MPCVFAVCVLCKGCRRQVERDAVSCPVCGTPRASNGAVNATFDLVVDDRRRIPVVRELTIGRAPGNAVQLDDPAVSRLHAVISPRPRGAAPVLRDAGSSYGTWVDGRRVDSQVGLRDGSRIEVGDLDLALERRRGAAEAGKTMLVPLGASLLLSSSGEPLDGATAETLYGARPRLRSGYALKRLEAGEGAMRWVLKDLADGRFVRMADGDVQLIELLDGSRSIGDLVRDAEHRVGPSGPTRIARLLADLGVRGLLAGSSAPEPAPEDDPGLLARAFRPRRRTWLGAGRFFERLYLRGGWLLFTRAGLTAVVLTMAAGLLAFVYLVAARYGTPFVVAHKVAIGALVFFAGRLLVVLAHETAHALTMSSFGRRVGHAGVKLMLVFPYAFVDTSDAWFEPRRRRIAISAAGPISDLTLGGAFALACLASPAGATRDVVFQLAFGAYLGALFNLNPLLERDGYQILVDVLHEPGLRPRALAQLRRRLAGGGGNTSRLLNRYAIWSLAWTFGMVVIAVLMSLRYEHAFAATAPKPVVWTVFATIWAGLLAVPVAIVAPPLRARLRGAA
jgi:putative peptide zinc metalloprotease protein